MSSEKAFVNLAGAFCGIAAASSFASPELVRMLLGISCKDGIDIQILGIAMAGWAVSKYVIVQAGDKFCKQYCRLASPLLGAAVVNSLLNGANQAPIFTWGFFAAGTLYFGYLS